MSGDGDLFDRPFDDDRAKAPASRVELYVVASRIVVLANALVKIAISTNTTKEFDDALANYNKVSRALEKVLDNLVLVPENE